MIALGESTHGTREFFQMKHRLLEYLVAEHGVTAFVIEAAMPEAFELNRYVLTGEGDPRRRRCRGPRRGEGRGERERGRRCGCGGGERVGSGHCVPP